MKRASWRSSKRSRRRSEDFPRGARTEQGRVSCHRYALVFNNGRARISECASPGVTVIDIGIDLGTANVLVYVRGKGIVLREPSVVAKDVRTNKTLAVGEEARLMLGKTPSNIQAIRPLRDGVIADFEVTEAMLGYFIKKVTRQRGFWATLFRPKPSVVICVPAEITSVEERAVRDAAKLAGGRKGQ